MNKIKLINELSERNSGSKWIRTVLRKYSEIPVSRSNVHMYPTEISMTNTARRSEYPNSLSDEVLNVIVVRNVFNWSLQMLAKPYHFNKDVSNRISEAKSLVKKKKARGGEPLLELINKPFISEMEMLNVPIKHRNPKQGWRAGERMQFCEGNKEDFKEVNPSDGIIDLRNKKYKKWLSFMDRGNFVIINYDNLINGNEEEFEKLQSTCLNKIERPKGWIDNFKARESYYLHPEKLKDFIRPAYDSIVEKMDMDLEEQLGFDWNEKIISFSGNL